MSTFRVRAGSLSVVAVAFFAFAAPNAESQEAAPPPKEPEHVVARGDLAPTAEMEGNVVPATKTPQRLEIESFGGPFIVEEVVDSGTAVKEGDVVIRLRMDRIEIALRDAREDLEMNERGFARAKQDAEASAKRRAIQLEKIARDVEQAGRALDSFRKYEEEQWLRGKDLDVKSSENRLADQKEELAQLESMYQGSEIAGETKDIVLERARRDVWMAEQYLDMTRKENQLVREFEHPERVKDLTTGLDHRTRGAELDRVDLKLKEEGSADDLVGKERDLRDLRDRLGKLERDAAAMTVKAPKSGVLHYKGLEAGESVQPRQVLFEIVDPTAFEVEAQASEGDLRLLAAGQAVNVRLVHLSEAALSGTVKEIGWMPASPAESGRAASYPVTVTLAGGHALLRPGMRARVSATGATLSGVIAVPRKALSSKNGKWMAKVKTADGSAEREVATGAGDSDRVHVLSGLAEGDVILLPAEGK